MNTTTLWRKAKEMEVPFKENVVRVSIKTYSSSFSNVKHSHEKKSPRTTVQTALLYFPPIFYGKMLIIFFWMMR
jgi:hypothetical protein